MVGGGNAESSTDLDHPYCCTNISIIGSGEPLYMVLGFLRDRISLRFLCAEIIGIQNAELQEIIDDYHAENF